MVLGMGWMEAAAWGLAGGLAAGLLALMTAVSAAGFRWPWKPGELWPRLFVFGCSMALGALVATAAHSQISGPWPAFVMGAGAPATIRGLLSGVEVATRLKLPADPSQDLADGAAGQEAVREGRKA